MAASCAEQGYARTSVADVAARANVKPKRFKKYFSDKAECGVAAVNEILSEAIMVASAEYSADRSELESTMRGIKAQLELMAARPSFANLAFIESRQGMPQDAYGLYLSGMRILASMLDRLRANSVSGADLPPSTARGALGGAEALVRRELLAGRASQLPELFPDIIYGALVPFLDQQEALRCAERARELLNEGR